MSLEILRSGVDAWNEWRAAHVGTMPDLRGARLEGRALPGVNLGDVVLAGADLSGADLRGADLRRSDTRGVLLTGADLRGADLRGAVLSDIHGGRGNAVVDITGADFTESVFGRTVIGDIYLNRMIGLGAIRHIGPSYVSTSTLALTVEEMNRLGAVRTDVEAFLKGAGVSLASFKEFERELRSRRYCSAFISYSQVDREFAQWLYGELSKKGVECWLDEKNIRAGERILDAVAAAIGRHEKIVLCCSVSSLESWWVKDEIRKAQELERVPGAELRIVPVLLDRHLFQWNHGLASDLRRQAAHEPCCVCQKG
jgi:hypothetical protein